MSDTLFIQNGMVYIDGRIVRKNILVENGTIKKIFSGKTAADETINASDMLILPGSIDPHVHFREPGLTHKEDFRTGSQAAAAGGVTSVLDMPNTKPPTLTGKLLEEKISLASSKSIVDFGFHFGSSADNIKEINKVEKSGEAASTKIFMDASTGNMLIQDDKIISGIIAASRMCTIHAEGRNARKAIEISEKLKKKFYLCHVSTLNELEYVKENHGKNVFAEVTPHHLFLTETDQTQLIRMKPSLKNESDRRALWDSLNAGLIDTIGSDHAPHTIEEKEAGDLYGVPGVETRLPLMLDAVNKRRLTLRRLVGTMCENPAKIFRLKNKGFIKKGYDADFVIVDMKAQKKIRNDEMRTKCGWSPFDGFEVRGWPVKTIVRGKIVFDDGDVVKNKGRGIVYG
ncbi:MAG: dihydroorotase family protein [Candidatus Aenigmatarchaeota archaeon]